MYFDWGGTLAKPGTRDAFVRGDSSSLYDDSHAVLALLLQRGYRCGIITNHSMPRAQFVRALALHRLPITASVVCLGAPDGLPWRKPDERAFYAALQHDRVFPHEAIMIGDKVHEDVHGATAAGMYAVHLDRRKESLLQLVQRIGLA